MSALEEIVVINNETRMNGLEEHCLICLEEGYTKISEYRKKESNCKCIYVVHESCLNKHINKNNDRCLLCKERIYSNKEIIENDELIIENNELIIENNNVNIDGYYNDRLRAISRINKINRCLIFLFGCVCIYIIAFSFITLISFIVSNIAN